jgi:hypothetical protein
MELGLNRHLTKKNKQMAREHMNSTSYYQGILN